MDAMNKGDVASSTSAAPRDGASTAAVGFPKATASSYGVGPSTSKVVGGEPNQRNQQRSQYQGGSGGGGGIGKSFFLANPSSSPLAQPPHVQHQQHQQQPSHPPPINNYFQSHANSSVGVVSNHPGSSAGGGINVDNIFASMAEDVGGSGSNNNGGTNSIFHNFAGAAPPLPANAIGNIPFRKYSDSNAGYGQGAAAAAGNVIPAATSAYGGQGPGAYPAINSGSSNAGYMNHQSSMTRSGSSGNVLLSKSMGTASFMRPGIGRNMSARYVCFKGFHIT